MLYSVHCGIFSPFAIIKLFQDSWFYMGFGKLSAVVISTIHDQKCINMSVLLDSVTIECMTHERASSDI